MLRRHPTFSGPFARTVGAHILTQTLVGNNRSSITEHDRSYKIFSNSFQALHTLLRHHKTTVQYLIDRDKTKMTPEELVLFFDYFDHYKQQLRHIYKESSGVIGTKRQRGTGVWQESMQNKI